MRSDGVSLMYQRVQRVECSFPRPVLLLGPLVEASKDLLVTESPAKFCRCLPGEPRCTSVRPDDSKTKISIKRISHAGQRLSWF